MVTAFHGGNANGKEIEEGSQAEAPVVDVKKAQADISTLLKPDILILQRHIS